MGIAGGGGESSGQIFTREVVQGNCRDGNYPDGDSGEGIVRLKLAGGGGTCV